ncbi:GTPase domain-containing protein [Kineosporia sp. A_224]|uniref:GTPase domain-containing protein n=1 Tax=Kineosporia sp. A_224 TaxID=1962180 RepID=UPI00117A3FB8|nr:GTPase domain-containing protein [Kineosporia sp. A_224]
MSGDSGKKSRQEWCPAVKEQFFGVEPKSEDPLPAHSQAVAACRGALSDAYRAARVAVVAEEMTRPFDGLLMPSEISDGPSSSPPMRILLMGRTMAGKSTLLAALTGGFAERIGVGAQRTTRDVFAAPALDLPDVEVVDTPGVGAKDGAQDVALAMAEVPGADLVVWVASNDSFQEETAQALRAVAFRGKPVVVALNCRAPLDEELAIEDFLTRPDSVFDQHEGHLRTIRSHLAAAGVRPVTEVLLHAEAARAAQTDDVGAQLRSASRIEALLEVLRRERLERRITRRIVREADEVRAQGLALRAALDGVAVGVREVVSVAGGLRRDQEQRAQRLVEACRQLLEDDIVRLIGQRREWHHGVTDFGAEVGLRWAEEQTSLLADLDSAVKQRVDELLRTLDEASTAAQREWATAVRPQMHVEGLRDFRGLWKRRVAGSVVGTGGALVAAVAGAKIGALAGLSSGPLGAVVGVVVGGIVGALSRSLRMKAQSLFKSKAAILEENRELLRAGIATILEELQAQVLPEVDGTIRDVRRQLTGGFEVQGEKGAAASAVADVVGRLEEAVEAAISTLDLQTVRCLLHADGRARLAASAERATRLPGVFAAVQVRDSASTEAWLFPPSSPEPLTFGRARSHYPGAGAATYVLGLTDQVPVAVRTRANATVVITEAAAPEMVLAAWSEALSHHLGTMVEITRPDAEE